MIAAGFMQSVCFGKWSGCNGEREKERKVYAGHRPRALRKGPLTSKLARAPPEAPQNYTSYS
eukprot:1141577-Pelagomonas_calceolata.AAC.3